MRKEELRQLYREKRKELTTQQIAERSKVLCDKYFAEHFSDQVKSVHVFLPIPGSGEVDSWLIINKLWEMGKVVITSVSDFKTYEMKHFLFDKDTEVVANKWGIPEPVGALSSYDVPDHILVPLLTFDKNGHRVGYGKGFYDRFLARFSDSKKLGLSLFEGVDEIEDVEKTDIALDQIISVS